MDGEYPFTPNNRFGTAKWVREDEKPYASQLQKTR